MGHDPQEIARRTTVARAAINELFDADGGEDDNCVNMFVFHHLVELEPAYWQQQTGTATPTPARVLELLVLRSHWGIDAEGDIDDDGIETFDFTLPGDRTDYVVTVKFDDDGQIEEIDMES